MGRRVARWESVGDGSPLVRSVWVYNCYLIPDGGDGRPLVIDAGLPSHGNAACRWLRDAGRDLDRSGLAVAATHLHSDHVGGIGVLETDGRLFGEVSVALPERGRSYVEGETPRSPGPREVARILPVLRSQRCSIAGLLEPLRAPRAGYGIASFVPPAAHPRWVADGDPVPGAPEWVTIVAPGHTDDSVAYYHAPTRTLASGDAVLTVGSTAWFNPEFVDPDLSEATEERLRSLRVDVLLPGHGRPLVGRDLLHRAIGPTGRPNPRRRRHG